jgi:hypothetical protein
MRGTGSVTESVPEPAEDVFAFLTDIDRLPEWNAIIAEVVERPDVVQHDAECVVEIKAMGTVSWDLHAETFWQRVLLSRIRGGQLRREVPASIAALARPMNEPTA